MKKKSLFLLIILAAIITMACSCSLLNLPAFRKLERLRGSGTLVTEEREIGAVDEVQIGGTGILHLKQGESAELIIGAEDNLMDRIKTSVVGDRLIIQPESDWFNLWFPTKEIHYYLTLPSIEELDAAGSITVEIESLNTDDLAISLSGSSNLQAVELETENFILSVSASADVEIGQLKSEELKASFSGSNTFTLGEAVATGVEIIAGGSMNLTIDSLMAEDVQLNFSGSADGSIGELTAVALDLKMDGSNRVIIESGSVEEQIVDINGSGTYIADDFKSEFAQIKIGGSSNARMWVTEELNINADGSTRVSYYGSPAVTQFTSGSSDIIPLGEKE
ncbi:MAG: DUF2807 domain-containing protein [Anaerolineaceae bacterium]|nr:DUF2807 domain-containing protein [Anaerolineaceae bacterium]